MLSMGFVTPLMLTFSLYFSIFNPEILPPDGFPIEPPKGLEFQELIKLERGEFLDRVLPFIEKRMSGRHLG